jgi:hypothetical protein
MAEASHSPQSPRVRIAQRIKAGECGRADMPFSEVCMHMRIAGKAMRFLLLQSPRGYVSVQLFEDAQACGMCNGEGHADLSVEGRLTRATCIYCEGTGWRRFSAPITTGEAGIYSDEQGYYFYPKTGEEVDA